MLETMGRGTRRQRETLVLHVRLFVSDRLSPSVGSDSCRALGGSFKGAAGGIPNRPMRKRVKTLNRIRRTMEMGFSTAGAAAEFLYGRSAVLLGGRGTILR